MKHGLRLLANLFVSFHRAPLARRPPNIYPGVARTARMRNLSFQNGVSRLTVVIDLIAAGFYASVAAGVTRLNFERSK